MKLDTLGAELYELGELITRTDITSESIEFKKDHLKLRNEFTDLVKKITKELDLSEEELLFPSEDFRQQTDYLSKKLKQKFGEKLIVCVELGFYITTARILLTAKQENEFIISSLNPALIYLENMETKFESIGIDIKFIKKIKEILSEQLKKRTEDFPFTCSLIERQLKESLSLSISKAINTDKDTKSKDNNSIVIPDIEVKEEKKPEKEEEIKLPTKTKASEVDDNFLISYETWVVSIMRKAEVGNTEHAFLMVEGINQFGKSTVRRYDLVIHDDRKNYSQILILPPDDTQAEVKTVANLTKGDKCYYQSWIITREQAAQLHKNILRDKDIANSPEGIRYFVSGDQSLIGKSSLKQGHSCFTWAREKLIEIEDNRKTFTKNLKPKITDCIAAKTSLYLPKPKKEEEKKSGFGFKFR